MRWFGWEEGLRWFDADASNQIRGGWPKAEYRRVNPERKRLPTQATTTHLPPVGIQCLFDQTRF
jgi:hypothetical protein